MAGFLGFFDFEKEGPGIAKDAPKKRSFVVFFEFFFRNLWKLISVNLVYAIMSLPIFTLGLANVGITNVARSIARDKHSFGLSDYIETIKKNWKQGLIAGILNTFICIILGFDIYFFFSMERGLFSSVCIGATFLIIFFFLVMNYYMWTLMITFKFSLKQIYINSFKFVIINLKNNFICFVCLALTYAIYVGLLFVFPNWAVLLIEFVVFILTFPSFKALLIQFCTFPSIKKYIIDPYYEENPDLDIEKRRDLGLIEDEYQTVINDDGEEENENVFDD
ncbi:MAG: YesL family protein [Clostridia bacterium]|nr:YesL family protein [Clostridia bacterium]